MIVKVFQHIMSRTLVQSRRFDLMTRRLLFPVYETVPSPRVSSVRIFCHSDFCTYDTTRVDHKRLLRLGGVSHNYFPQRTSALLFSSGENEKEQKKGNTKETERSKQQVSVDVNEPVDEDKNLSIFKRFKKMYRDYWYVLVPVHVITSLGWCGGFYYLAKSGVDIKALLEMLGVSEHIPETLKDSSAGYLAVTYALYKIATPLRYMVTIGGTTISIKYLKGYGYIKPIPPKEKLKEMYQEKKETFREKRQNLTVGMKQKREQLKEHTETLIRDRRKKQ